MYHRPLQILQLLTACILAIGPRASWASPADDQFAVAAGHYERAHWQLAAEEFQTYLAEYEDHSPERSHLARFFRGEALVQLGQYGPAREAFTRFLDAAPRHKHAPRALFRIAESAYLAGDGDAARQTLQKFRKEHPADDLLSYVLPYLGELTLEAGDAAGAQDIYVDALRRFSDGPQANECRFGLGRALQQQGDVEAAAKFLAPLSTQTDHPRADDAQLQLGILHYNAARYDEAAKTLSLFGSTFSDSEFKGDARYWQAMAYLALSHWDQAIKAFEEAAPSADAEREPLIAYYTAQAHAAAGRLDDAVHHYDRVLANWPAHGRAPAAALARLEIHLRQSNHAAVEAQAQQFVRRYPDSPLRTDVSRILGRSRLSRQQYARAAEEFQPLADHQQQSSDIYYLAVAQLGAQQQAAALATLRNVDIDQAEPSLADAVRVARASALMGLARYEEAVAPLTAYLESQPKGADAAGCRADLIVALAATGQLKRARKVYGEYAERHPQHASLLQTTEFLAEAAMTGGERETARDMFAVLARESNPDDVIAKGLSGLARIDLDANDPAASQDSFDRLRTLKADRGLVATTALQRARAHRDAQHHDTALATYRVIIDDHPESELLPAALWEAARLHIRLKQYRDAAPLLERLVREHPRVDFVDGVLYEWAWLLVETDRPDEADAIFTRLHLEHPQSLYWPDVTYRLAERAVAQQELSRAQELAQEVVEVVPAGEIKAHGLYLLGQIAIRAGDWDTARPPLEQLCRQCPDSPLRSAAEYWLAEATYRLGELEDAQQRLELLADNSERDNHRWRAMVELRRAQVLARQKKWGDALELAVTIAERFPDFERQYEADYLMGRCLASQGRFREARAAYQRVVHSGTGRPTETAAMAQWMIGETYFHQKNYDEAVRAYARVEILWDYPRWKAAALLQIGKCHEVRGQWETATKHYHELTTKYPETKFAKEGERRLSVVQQRASLPTPVEKRS